MTSMPLPSQADLSKLAGATDELDNAFDSISGVNDQIMTQESTASASSDLPSQADFDALDHAANELDEAFDSISGLNDQVVPPGSAAGARRAEPAALPDMVVEFRQAATGDTEDFALDDSEEVEPDFDLHTPVSFGDSLGAEWDSCRPLEAPPNVSQRMKQCVAVAEVQALYFTDPSLLKGTADLLDPAVAAETSWRHMEPVSVQRVQAEGSLEKKLALLEAHLDQLDQKIKASWLRGTYLTLQLDRSTRASYFEACVRRADLSTDWWERVTILAMSSAATLEDDGLFQLLPIDEVAVLWDHILPRSRLDEESIQASVGFFHDAIGRLRETREARQLFTAGLYLDVIGYQISLRDAFFRPEILYACVLFHAELSNWLASGEHRLLRTTLDKDIAEVYAAVRKIFKSQFEDENVAERLRARLRGHDAQRTRKKRAESVSKTSRATPEKNRETRGKRFRMVGMVAALAVFFALALPMGMGALAERSRDLKSMAGGDVNNLHPMLLSGTQSPEASLLVAKIDGDKWMLLSPEQRDLVARDILNNATERGMQSVMVYNGDFIVLQIAEGEIRYRE